ncbi:MAG: M1 family metallopeptidase, partial [Desulfobacteraceae bacterium]|nr:M1 family metallopeptidase [Desulfobacteraceae bacterium]
MTTTIRPITYTIDLTPDLERFQFKGRVLIHLKADSPTDTLALNVLELAVWNCRFIQHEGKNEGQLCAFTQTPDRQSLTIELPEKITGEFKISIDYEGIINDTMAGFYRSGFKKNGQTRYLAVTQFQESSARQAFPCMDHPMHKAVFNLSMTVPSHLEVIANTNPVNEKPVDGGKKRITFAPTPIMSTYLVFFGLGEFEKTTDTQDSRVRVIHLPGLARTTGLGLDFGRKALEYCESYYGIAYPLPKMDLIAVPDFAFGAMENWGAITFRENLLLRYPGVTSMAAAQRICEIIAHEIAHQWFGNLVTPSDWKYLWLNESFATYFGYGVVDHYYPQWQVWDQFLNAETAFALTRDGLENTFSIEIPGDEHIAINAATAPIIYNKGGSILRMIEGYIGSDLYQKGVRTYLQQHQYGCAQSRHLWQAFESASNQPVTTMMKSWINQPGYPVVKVQRKGNKLHLSQKRFTYMNGDYDQTWQLPITLSTWNRKGQKQCETRLMNNGSLILDLAPDATAYKFNTGQTGFYRVNYEDNNNLEILGEFISSEKLSAGDRWGIQNDLYALVRQCGLCLNTYLDYLSHYSNECSYLPITGIIGNLSQITRLAAGSFHAKSLKTESLKERVAGLARKLADSVLDKIGHAPAENEPQTTTLMREQVLWQAVQWGSDKALSFARDEFDKMTAGHDVHPDIAKAALQSGAFSGGPEELEWLK